MGFGEMMKYASFMGGGGTGGGVSSWNDLTDKPFDIVELMPETEFTYNASMGYFVAQTDFELVCGRTYTVRWNGVEYTDTARFATNDTMMAIMVGNEVALGGEDNGLPFVVARIPLDPTAKGILGAIPLDGSTSIAVGIKGIESSEFYDTLVLDARLDMTTAAIATIYATKEQIINAFMAGRTIITHSINAGSIDELGVFNKHDIVCVTTGAELFFLRDLFYQTIVMFKYNDDGTYIPSSD